MEQCGRRGSRPGNSGGVVEEGAVAKDVAAVQRGCRAARGVERSSGAALFPPQTLGFLVQTAESDHSRSS